jgi:hypothetical protein
VKVKVKVKNLDQKEACFFFSKLVQGFQVKIRLKFSCQRRHRSGVFFELM